MAPRSVVFNWAEEAARFVPELRVHEHSGPQRERDATKLQDHDVVLTTYGTLRRDIASLSEMDFDVVVLDEAQAIKNHRSATAKAARLLTADHRLALSGTPIENHLGELWSLFEFLNPGMLGKVTAFNRLAKAPADVDSSTRDLLARTVAPFVLRRTKRQVAPELPERVEQTVWCELDAEQRNLYDELRTYYRQGLSARLHGPGIGGTEIYVLEALLRLRQAACHPGLLDEARLAEPSAKLDVLLPSLVEVIEEGHSVLVFSQFTSFLAIVRERVQALGLPHAYLDGATPASERRAEVARFQAGQGCPLFLISLKAGGLGLNLTAADHVFLLDPWWNPAVEAQAIDRAHRIGQVRTVMARRLVARDTVEERILELQASKRELADAILSADGSLLKNLTREELERLLS